MSQREQFDKRQRSHELKCWQPFFQQILDGIKPFELRRNDRDFKVGDVLHLREYENTTRTYTGREVRATVTCIIPGSAWGLRDGYCAMGIALASTRSSTAIATDAFNAAIDFALDTCGTEATDFLTLWREGAWDEIAESFPQFKGPFPSTSVSAIERKSSDDVPLCGGCAQAWFTERNLLPGDQRCVVCAFLGNPDCDASHDIKQSR